MKTLPVRHRAYPESSRMPASESRYSFDCDNKGTMFMPRQSKVLFLICSIVFLLGPAMAKASNLSLERALQQNFKKSRVLLARMERELASGKSYQNSLTELKGLGETIRTDHQALLAQLNARGGQTGALGGSAASRQAVMQERYTTSVSGYLSSLDALRDGQVTMAAILQLQTILAEILPEKPHRIHGSVPYRHLNLPARRPVSTPEVVPAYRGGGTDFAGADLAASPEAPISPAIAGLAQSLDWNPVTMYEWVKNNIKTEWYWGAMKGAEETLRQQSGNDADQAALLVALFRSAGFPARYVRGVMEFFPDLGAARAQTGLDDPLDLARFFQKAGVPYETVIAGGRISNFRIEHVWVEVEIPYDNYRGALLDELGTSWLALDTSIKTAGYATTTPVADLTTLDLAGVRESYLAGFKTETPLEYLAAQINAQLAGSSAGATYADLLQRRTINQEHMQIIPAGLQFKEIVVIGEYARLPAELLHRARFIARAADGTTFFDQSLPIYQLSNRSLAVTFEPETIEDQEIMNAFGGLDLTPLYLIRLRPVLTVAGEREIVGQGGLTAGADFTLAVELVAPGWSERVENTLVAGYPTLIGLAAQQAVLPAEVPPGRKNAERLLFERAMTYIDQGNKAEEELASLLQLQIVRPLPTLVTVGGVLDVVSLLDAPHGFTWQGVYLDADLRAAEALGGMAPAGSGPGALFMQLASLQSSVLEHRALEEGFGVESVSTAKLLALANGDGLPLAVIDTANLDATLPPLHLPDSIHDDIENSVQQGYRVTLPETELTHEDWSGYAWIKEDRATYESGWMLAGAIAGGMTALNPSLWPVDYYDILTNPEVVSTDDPASAVEIRVIEGSDILAGTAGKQLPTPLQIMALDQEGNRVKGVEVRFEVKAGGGKVSKQNTAAWQTSVQATTGYDGIARADLLFAESTNGNPTTARRVTDEAVQRVDETVIAVTTTTGLRTAAPVSAYGFPDAPHHLRVSGGDAAGPILSWAATLIASVEDQYNNPHSGEQVEFVMGAARPGSECGSVTSTRPGLLIGAEDPCVGNIPVYGQCGSGSVTGMTGLHLGAAAHVLLGDRPGADYPVTVTSGALNEQVTVTANPAGPCDPEDPPYSALVLRVIHDTDAQGNIISAGPVSTREKTATVPILARLYAIREQGTEVPKEIPCLPSGTDTCPVWQGTGVYEIATDFVNASVSFDGTEAEPLGDGLYRVNYPLASTPKKHDISVTGTATEKEKINVHVCDDRNDCQLIEADNPIEPVSHSATAYAVEVTVPLEQHIIPVNEDGYVTADFPLAYTIEPPEYTAATADVVLSEKNDSGGFEEIDYLSAETSGQGEMTFLTGFRFDQEKEYRAQVVLNEGSDSMEIRSKEISLVPLTLELDADLNRDGMWKEDDPLEHTAPGLVVPLNLDDDDGDGVLDNIDGSNADGIAGNADDAMAKADAGNNTLTPVQDDDLIEVKLRALPADLAEGTVHLEVVNDSPRIRLWTTQEKGSDNLLLDTATATSTEFIIGSAEYPTMAELPSSIYAEGIRETDTTDGVILLAKYIPADGGNEIETDRIRLSILDLEFRNDQDPEAVQELRFSNSDNPKKLYHMVLKGVSSDSCSGLTGTIRVIDKNGQKITPPGDDFCPTEYPLTFSPRYDGCRAILEDKEKLIVTNQHRSTLEMNPLVQQAAKIYGGMGNKVEVEINDLRFRHQPIEPLGIIVLAIDGLRQDVLYPRIMDGKKFRSFDEGDYYVPANDPSQLPGLSQILLGDPTQSATQSYVMLPNVTAVFPSITLASWASIFTGKMPKDTGIMGNEFFARDLLDKEITLTKIGGDPAKTKVIKGGIPDRFENPKGVVSLSSGAFKGYDDFFELNLPLVDDFFIPYQFSWSESVAWEQTPQNNEDILKPDAKTIFEILKEDDRFNKMHAYYQDSESDPVVVSYSHYARGADYWLTWDADFNWSWPPDPFDASRVLDESSKDKFEDYLCGKYEDGFINGVIDCSGSRNDIPFSALTVWYLPGLDHEAHFKSMSIYRDYFTSVTDNHVMDIVHTLKHLDEFDNKIFIIVADHGMTAMPTDQSYNDKNWLGQTVIREAKTDCELQLDFIEDDIQNAELANNNLHTWEFAKLLNTVGMVKGNNGLDYKTLAPEEISELFTGNYGANAKETEANVIAALNGPMAHIYLKNKQTGSWKTPRLVEDVGYMAELLRLTLSLDKSPSNLPGLFTPGLFDKVLPITAGVKRLRNSIDLVLIRKGNTYEQFKGITMDGSDLITVPVTDVSRYVETQTRLAGLEHPDRSGDIVLVFRDNIAEQQIDRFTSGVACKAWHGSMNPSDSYVPMILSYPGGNKEEIHEIMSRVSDCPNQQCGGNWDIPDIIKETLIRQYQQE
jgi:transglutaminase-like putative cysteine protease